MPDLNREAAELGEYSDEAKNDKEPELEPEPEDEEPEDEELPQDEPA